MSTNSTFGDACSASGADADLNTSMMCLRNRCDLLDNTNDTIIRKINELEFELHYLRDNPNHSMNLQGRTLGNLRCEVASNSEMVEGFSATLADLQKNLLLVMETVATLEKEKQAKKSKRKLKTPRVQGSRKSRRLQGEEAEDGAEETQSRDFLLEDEDA